MFTEELQRQYREALHTAHPAFLVNILYNSGTPVTTTKETLAHHY